MQVGAEKKIWTDEALMALEHDGHKCELVEGEIIMSPVGMQHEYVGAILLQRLTEYVRKNRLGVVLGSSIGYRLKRGNVRSPDVSFISKNKLVGVKHPSKKFPHFAPDLAVEILSPDDTVEGLHQKIVEYFDNETKLVWVVNPEEQTVLVYHSPQPDTILRISDQLQGENVVPGFTMQVADLFAEFDF